LNRPRRASKALLRRIIKRALASGSSNVIVDISLPPGGGKTFNVVQYIVENRIDAIMTFPYHQNQLTALLYIFSTLEEMKTIKLKQFIVDYAGLENYCIFYKPELLAKLLDKFKTSPNESYRDAVLNMFANDIVFRILLAKGVDVEELWIAIAEALDEYVKAKNRKSYLALIKNIVEKKGQYEICTSVCPLGLFAWWYRKELYKFFSEYKIITWRNLSQELRNYPHVAKFVVQANPANFVENIENLLSGKFKPEWILCLRYILMTKISMRENRPTFISTRKSIILTPHAGLEFVASLVRRQVEVSKVKRQHILYIDEYDSILHRPVTWPLLSIEAVKTVIAVANKLTESEVGSSIHGVEVDEYLKRYATYVKDLFTLILETFEEATKTKVYHPIVNIFVEGAFSIYTETVKNKIVTYKPLGARVVHIRHFLSDERSSRLLRLALNPHIYFYDLASEDRDWILRYREAVIKFRQVLRATKTFTMFPIAMSRNGEKMLHLTMRLVKFSEDPVKIVRSYLSPLLQIPRYVVYYAGEQAYDVYRIRLHSIDIRIHQFFVWSKSAIITSATPVPWNIFVLSSNPIGIYQIEYERVVNDQTHSLVAFEPPEVLIYEDRAETIYEAHAVIYTNEFREKLTDFVSGRGDLKYDESALMRIDITVVQVAPKTPEVFRYAGRFRTIFISTLKPLKLPEHRDALAMKEFTSTLNRYLDALVALYKKGETALVLVQNKAITYILAKILRATPCSGHVCGENADPEKLSHYVALSNKVIITYFRSRSTRGIELPYNFTFALVIGSPHPRPSIFVHSVSESELVRFVPKRYIKYVCMGYNTYIFTVLKALTPRDFVSGVSEFLQAIGRALRSALLHSSRVILLIPSYLQGRIIALAPLWFRMSVTTGLELQPNTT